MKNIKIVVSRIYNANRCILNNDEEVFRCLLGSIEVIVSIASDTKHPILAFKLDNVRGINREDEVKATNNEFAFPGREVFPADLYCEIEVIDFLELDSELVDSYNNGNQESNKKVSSVIQEKEYSKIIDYVAALIGLRFSNILVSKPITEQTYIYCENKPQVTISASIPVVVHKTFDYSRASVKNLSLIKELKFDFEDKIETLRWLLRAWNAEDEVLRFVSLFIPLERVIPPAKSGKSIEEEKVRARILSIVNKHASIEDSKELTDFLSIQISRKPSLFERFRVWATEIELPGWKDDVDAFDKFTKKRNLLLHQGKLEGDRKVFMPGEVKKLEDIVERYINFKFFGIEARPINSL